MQTTTKGITDNDLMNFPDWIKAYNEDWPQRLSVSRLMLALSPEERYIVFRTAARLAVFGMTQSDRATIDNAEEPEREGEAVNWIDAADFATAVSLELEKAKYLLQEVLDYLGILRYAVEQKDYTKACNYVFGDICGVETMARIMGDVLFNLSTATADFTAKIKAD